MYIHFNKNTLVCFLFKFSYSTIHCSRWLPKKLFWFEHFPF